MDWRAKVELYEQIRREYEFGVGSVIGVARKLGVHRRMVREAVRNAVPAQRKKTERPAVKMAPAVSLIDAILELDRKAPRKQRHTARRINERIHAEIPGCSPAERTVRQYMERRKHALGLAEHETFVPQTYDWGVEARVDWYEAYADVDGERIKLQVFSMRSMASGAAFHRAYPCATQQAFLEAHELAFAYFDGVFRRLRYDNLSSAVKKILRGQQRELTVRFIAFRSHWQYQAEFCTPSEGHEKGGVEGEVGYFCRNHWVPVPVATDLQALNRKLLEDCQADESRMVSGRTETVGTRLLAEKDHLLPRAVEVFDLAEVSLPRVDQSGCATNSYSVPLMPGSIVEAHVLIQSGEAEVNQIATEIVRVGVANASIKGVTPQRLDYLDEAGQERFVDLEECIGSAASGSSRCVGRRGLLDDPPWIEFTNNRRTRFEFGSSNEASGLKLEIMKARWRTLDGNYPAPLLLTG